jgi:hypothetical protein
MGATIARDRAENEDAGEPVLLRPRRPCAKAAAVTSSPFPFAAALLLVTSAAALALGGCSGPIECKTEITNGSQSFTGAAVGKADDAALRTASVRDACRQKCAVEKATMIDACTAACVTDATSAAKIGARTTCGRK